VAKALVDEEKRATGFGGAVLHAPISVGVKKLLTAIERGGLAVKRTGPTKGGAGVTLPELLVVIAIISMVVTISVPLIAGAVRSSAARAAANGFAVSLKAARMLAVSINAPVQVTVQEEPHPDCYCGITYYEYPDRRGELRRTFMPPGVTIDSSTPVITFMPNGSVPGGSNTVIRTQVSPEIVENWTIETTSTGFSVVRLERTQ
jgi:prepilin-type N-terminal cleavage/methylation domain-containing protein